MRLILIRYEDNYYDSGIINLTGYKSIDDYVYKNIDHENLDEIRIIWGNLDESIWKTLIKNDEEEK